MKKIGSVIIGLFVSTVVWGAQVSVDSIDSNEAPENYTMSGQSYKFGSQNFDVFVNEKVPGSTGNANQEELLYLGAHESFANRSGDTTIVVDIEGAASGNTGPVSIVLSAAKDTTWDFQIEGSLQLNNIFILAQGIQTVMFNGETISLDFSEQQFSGLTNIRRSSRSICGYALPDDLEGCNTDQILGLSNSYPDPDFPIDIETNPDNDNFLAELTNLQVTSFSGSYFADRFNVTVDSAAVVPLPAAMYLFCSAFACLCVFKKQKNIQSSS